MKGTMTSAVKSRLTVMAIAFALVASAILLSGCPDRITGEQTANMKPVVYFVNIPPENYQTSRNPVIYWIGSDPDGQVRQFRYKVVLESEMGLNTPAQYISSVLNSLPASEWTYLNVDDSLPDPQTQQAVRMQADLSDPVNVFVPQYVFLQAFDEQGTGSDIIYRRFNRNDNPPQTFIRLPGTYDELTSPFINAVNAGGAITGVRIGWYGEDKTDYPSDPPPFEFEWKLLGPFTYDSTNNNEFRNMMRDYVKKVFLANDGRLYRLGDHDTILYYCDSLDTSADPDTLVHYLCTRLLVDTITSTNPFGTLDSMFMIDDPGLINAGLRRVADSSGDETSPWVSNLADTSFDVYRLRQPDTTTEEKFVLWVRSRDDANVPDLVPAFKPINVIEPKYEREVLVIDFTRKFRRLNGPKPVAAYNYWRDIVNAWKPNTWDTTDYYNLDGPNKIPLKKMLQYKIAVLYSDSNEKPFLIDGKGLAPPAITIFKAIDAGVNVVQFARSAGPEGVDKFKDFTDPTFPVAPPAEYQRYFGITGFVYHGWWHYALDTSAVKPSVRIEDFVGAYSLRLEEDDAASFPDLTLDTANMHQRYEWGFPIPPLLPFDRSKVLWIDSVACMPEVGWVSRQYGTEPLYLYKSKFGLTHPLGPQLSYDGSPVAIRYETSLFKTAHFSFTPLGMNDAQMYTMIHAMFNWLYPTNLGAAPNETINRNVNAATSFSVDQVRRNEEARMAEYKRMNGIQD